MFTFTTEAAKSGISRTTDELLNAMLSMSESTSPHITQIFEELNGAALAELPPTYEDVTMSDDWFEDRHGVCKQTAASMHDPEPHLIERGCRVVHGIVLYFGTVLVNDEVNIFDSFTLGLAGRRTLEVHLAHIHNIPTEVLMNIADLYGYHQGVLDEFSAACVSQPIPTAP